MLEGHLLQFGSAADIFNDATGAGEQFVKRDDLGGVDVAPIQLEAGRAVLVVERAQVADDEIAARRDRIDGRLIGTAKGIGQPLMKAPLGELVNSLLNLGYRVRDLVRHAVATGSIFVLAQQGRVGSLQFNQDELAYLRPRTHERIDALARPVERRARRGGFQLPTHWIKEDVVESVPEYPRVSFEERLPDRLTRFARQQLLEFGERPSLARERVDVAFEFRTVREPLDEVGPCAAGKDRSKLIQTDVSERNPRLLHFAEVQRRDDVEKLSYLVQLEFIDPYFAVEMPTLPMIVFHFRYFERAEIAVTPDVKG